MNTCAPSLSLSVPSDGGGELTGFGLGRFAADSDDSLDEADIDDYLNEGRKGVNGELNDEEDAQLNPLRTAYLEGWNRAEEEG